MVKGDGGVAEVGAALVEETVATAAGVVEVAVVIGGGYRGGRGAGERKFDEKREDRPRGR